MKIIKTHPELFLEDEEIKTSVNTELTNVTNHYKCLMTKKRKNMLNRYMRL